MPSVDSSRQVHPTEAGCANLSLTIGEYKMPNFRNLEEVQDYLTSKIPMTSILKFQLLGFTDGITAALPLAPNLNDKKTGFAGSLNAGLNLAGWAQTQMICSRFGLDTEVVLFRQESEFRAPVTKDVFIQIQGPTDDQINHFIGCLKAKKKGKIRLQV